MHTITRNGRTTTYSGDFDLNVHENNVERELITWRDLNENERNDFEYLEDSERDDARLFRYLGSVYDYYEFEVAPHWLKALGYDAIQTDSAFSATVVRYFDSEGHELEGIVVARIHW